MHERSKEVLFSLLGCYRNNEYISKYFARILIKAK